MTTRILASVAACMVVLTAGLGPVGSASAAFSSATESTHVAPAGEAYELSGLTASPQYPNWYWAHSDVWKAIDTFSACATLTGAPLAECQQVQRARIWALKIDPVTHAIVETRSFSVSDPAWALDPFVAQNNDWEDISVGPAREGDPGRSLVIAATGNAQEHRVYDAEGRDITCTTRRLIELPEPDLSDAAVTTWSPSMIYDLKNWTGMAAGLNTCNVESLVVSEDPTGGPTAYLVSKTAGKLLTRSLALSTGRDPATPAVAPESTMSYRPQVTYGGALRNVKGLKITAGDVRGTKVSLLVPRSSSNPCQILTWTIGNGGLGAALTSTSPVKNQVTCTANAEGMAYTRSVTGSVSTPSALRLVADMQSIRSTFTHWYLPDL